MINPADPVDALALVNGWRLDQDGVFHPANLDVYEYCVDVGDAKRGKDRVMAEYASLLHAESTMLKQFLSGERKQDDFGAPLEIETLLTDISFYTEMLRRLSLSDHWPSERDIRNMMIGNEPPASPRAHV